MPVYDFKCECGNTRTQTISINAPDFKAICICGKEMIRGKPTMLIRQSMEKLLNFVQLTVRVTVKDLTRNNLKIRSESGSTFS